MAVKSPRLGLVQRRAHCEASRQIGIGNEELAERHSIGLALCESLVGSLKGELLVDDVDAPKLALESRTEPAVSSVFTRVEKGEPTGASFPCEIAKGFCRVRVEHVVFIGAWRD